jgi:hypothetical protein
MDDFVTIATLFSVSEAEPLRLALEAAGISVLATDETIGEVLASNMVGGIKLQVPAAEAERAAEVLAELRTKSESLPGGEDDSEDDDGVSLKCAKCGADIWFPSDSRGEVETCPECGSQVDVPA